MARTRSALGGAGRGTLKAGPTAPLVKLKMLRGENQAPSGPRISAGLETDTTLGQGRWEPLGPWKSRGTPE